MLTLAEVDQGNLPEFVNDLVTSLEERIKKELTAAAGAKIGFESGGPIGAAVGLAIGFVAGRVFGYLAEIWGDEMFPPVSLMVKIPSLTHTFNGKIHSPDQTVTVRAHGGTYRIRYDWLLQA